MTRNIWYSAGWAAIALYARLMLNLDVAGRDRIPAGSKLIVANHPSSSDPFYLPLIFRHPIDMLLIDSAFLLPPLGAFLRRVGQISVTCGDGHTAFAEAHRRLTSGRSVALFPEGNVSPHGGGTLTPRGGAARLALTTDVPVLPVGIGLPRDRVRHVRATIRGRSLNGHWHLRGPYAMTVGEPLRFEGDVSDTAHVASVSSRIMNTITSLASESERRLHR